MIAYNLESLPQVSMTGKVREDVGWSHSGRKLNVNLLVVFHRGNCTITIDGAVYTFEKGDIAIIPRDTLYAPNTENFCEYTFFHFDGDLFPSEKTAKDVVPFDEVIYRRASYGYINMEKTDAELLFDYKVTLGTHAQNVELLVRKCMNTRLNYEEKQQLLLSIQFCEILFYISQAFCEGFRSGSALPSQVNKILTYIKENYTGPITLDDICKNMNMSKQYCMRIFKKHMHATINDYILELRMRHAAYLLSSTYMNVSQTADYLGFSGTSYFSRVFKQFYGVSPSEYQE